ncbi:[similarity to] outer membrane efflux protein [methanotrophic bacterial endosymbiont of Bathymodiolus sp.]|nr:[similarity to] outer membrane efflux protein [methanotrophic bacterial endosymbiont of Bathymodiolus sp.]
MPVWNWRQRDAGLQLAPQARQGVGNAVKAIKLKVSGLVREALWAQKLALVRFEMKQKEFAYAQKLARTVQRRVEVGDLPKADYYLAESELLEKKAALINTKAKLMHARKRYYFLTLSDNVPEQFNEEKSKENSINEAHPSLLAINSTIARKKAQVEWLKAQGSGQTTVAVGEVSERGSREDNIINTKVSGFKKS